MLGKNTIHLNQETVQEAIRRYLCDVMFKSPVKVATFKPVQAPNTYSGGADYYEAEIEPLGDGGEVKRGA